MDAGQQRRGRLEPVANIIVLSVAMIRGQKASLVAVACP
jgi:hypothetical protein